MEVSNRGIETHYVSNCVMNNLVLMGQFGNAGLICVEGTTEHPLSVTNFNINAFTYGIYNAANDVTAGPGTIRNCTTGIYTNASNLRAVYQGIQFDACTTPVSAYQAGSKFFKLVNRVSGQAVLCTMTLPKTQMISRVKSCPALTSECWQCFSHFRIRRSILRSAL
jgi:hypothetical protein